MIFKRLVPLILVSMCALPLATASRFAMPSFDTQSSRPISTASSLRTCRMFFI